jgi:hypothetical protein
VLERERKALILHTAFIPGHFLGQLVQLVPRHAVFSVRNSELIEQFFIIEQSSGRRTDRHSINAAVGEAFLNINCRRLQFTQIEVILLSNR